LLNILMAVNQPNYSSSSQLLTILVKISITKVKI
jgi:hypothetical protein